MSDTASDSWAGVPTGPELGARLAPIDPHDTGDAALLDLLHAQWRQLAYQQAQVWAVMAEIAVRDPFPNLPGGTRWNPTEIFESAVDEIRAELVLTRRRAGAELATAYAVASMPRVLQALRTGEIDRARAWKFAEACTGLTAEQTEVLLDELLPDAGQVTATWLADKIARVAMALDPQWAEHRYRQAVKQRRVIGYLNPDGSATVSGQNLPADDAAVACARVDALADAAKRAGATAKIDHLRAELFLGLLDGRFHGMTEPAIITELLRLFPEQPDEPVEEPAAEPAIEPKSERRTVPVDETSGPNGAPTVPEAAPPAADDPLPLYPARAGTPASVTRWWPHCVRSGTEPASTAQDVATAIAVAFNLDPPPP